MKELIEKVFSTDLTPNQYFLLYCLRSGLYPNYNFNPTIERKNLKSKGYLDESGNMTNKCSIFDDPLDMVFHASIEFEEDRLNERALEIMRVFPIRRLRSGYARGSLKDVKERLRRFLALYTYDWETVLKGAQNYIKYWEANEYKYMKSCANFIFSEGDSTLSKECDIIEHNHQMQDFGKVI